MKHKIFLLMVIIAVAFALTSVAYALDRANYIALKAGSFTPGGDAEDFDSGGYGEVAFGHNFNEYFALEASIAGTSVEHPESEATVDIAPIFSVNAKGIIPINRVELYGMVGIGVYNVTVEGVSVYEISDTVTGTDLGLGFLFKATDSFGIGVEWKTFATEDVGEWEFELEGSTLTGVLRFSF